MPEPPVRLPLCPFAPKNSRPASFAGRLSFLLLPSGTVFNRMGPGGGQGRMLYSVCCPASAASVYGLGAAPRCSSFLWVASMASAPRGAVSRMASTAMVSTMGPQESPIASGNEPMAACTVALGQ